MLKTQFGKLSHNKFSFKQVRVSEVEKQQWESEGDRDRGVHLRSCAIDDIQRPNIGKCFIRYRTREWCEAKEDSGELDGRVHCSSGWNSAVVVVVFVAIKHRKEISISILEHRHHVRLRGNPIRRIEPLHRRKALCLGSNWKDSNTHCLVHCKSPQKY